MLVRRHAVSGDHGAPAPSGPVGEAHLLSLVVGGDQRAFEELYRIYYPRLTRFLGNMLRRRQLVEEVLDDCMLAIWKRP